MFLLVVVVLWLLWWSYVCTIKKKNNNWGKKSYTYPIALARSSCLMTFSLMTFSLTQLFCRSDIVEDILTLLARLYNYTYYTYVLESGSLN